MSIEKYNGRYTPTCDICGEELDSEYEFMDAVAAKKAAKWRSYKDDGEWIDSCPDCAMPYNQAASDFSGVTP